MARYYRIDKPNLGEIKPVIYPGYQTPVLLNVNGDAPMIESRFWGFVLNMPGKRDPSQPVAFSEPVGGEFKSIYDPERPIISVAGIWAEQTYKDKRIQVCTMLTTEPDATLWVSQISEVVFQCFVASFKQGFGQLA